MDISTFSFYFSFFLFFFLLPVLSACLAFIYLYKVGRSPCFRYTYSERCRETTKVTRDVKLLNLRAPFLCHHLL